MKSVRIKSRADAIRLRNIIVYKAFGTSAAINKFVPYRISDKQISRAKIVSLINLDDLPQALVDGNIRYIGQMALQNRFDLLGSGWVRWAFGQDVLGILGCNYQERFPYTASEYDAQITKYKNYRKYDLGNKYDRIAWNRDIKTGYVWPIGYLDENTCIDSPRGVDVKTVWELGRMNYLVPLALCAYAETDINKRSVYVSHYGNILKDFASSNPVGVGVQWMLSMEASIRISNILMSYDVIRQLSVDAVDSDVERLVKKLSLEHVMYIWQNIEKNIVSGINGNHYFSNIAGLLVACAYLKGVNKTKRIYEFAKKEFYKEVCAQFYSEGGHRESSSGYFRLVAEMAVICSAVLIKIGEKIPEAVVDIMIRNKDFALALKRKEGDYFSFGDCDSGRFIKVAAYGEFVNNYEAEQKYLNLSGYAQMYGHEGEFFVENHHCLDGLVHYTDGLMNIKGSGNSTLEEAFIRAIAGEKSIFIEDGKAYGGFRNIKDSSHRELRYELFPHKKVTEIGIPERSAASFFSRYFQYTGLFIIRAEDFVLFFQTGKNEAIGHGHNDTMNVEYTVDGVTYGGDHGTFTYTGFEDMRDTYRGAVSHNVPQYLKEQKEFNGFFGFDDSDYREIVEYTDRRFALFYKNAYYQHIREIHIMDECIIIKDYGSEEFKLGYGGDAVYSPAYGVVERKKGLL